MKSILIVCISFLILTSAFAQTETEDSKSVATKFIKFYNSNLQDSIFSIFSAETKQALPLDKTRAFLTRLSAYGHINQLNFIEYKNGFGVYKATLEKGLITLSIAIDGQNIIGLNAKPFDATSKMLRNVTKMNLPFKGEWTVFWGGDNKEQNYHVIVNFQKNAFDIVINNPAGKSYKTDGKNNEDYYAFAQPLSAPCDGEIVMAVNGVKDNIPGQLNPLFATGNSILIKTKNKEYVLMAHFKQNSLKVKQGDFVKQGQILGLCGNSGNSSEPHLHFHIQDNEDFNKAIGIKCYFDKLQVNGIVKSDYSPVKGEHIKPTN